MRSVTDRILPMLPSGWTATPLRYMSTCLDGKRVPLNVEERSDRRGDYPYWGANGVVDTIDEFIFDEPLVLYTEPPSLSPANVSDTIPERELAGAPNG